MDLYPVSYGSISGTTRSSGFSFSNVPFNKPQVLDVPDRGRRRKPPFIKKHENGNNGERAARNLFESNSTSRSSFFDHSDSGDHNTSSLTNIPDYSAMERPEILVGRASLPISFDYQTNDSRYELHNRSKAHKKDLPVRVGSKDFNIGRTNFSALSQAEDTWDTGLSNQQLGNFNRSLYLNENITRYHRAESAEMPLDASDPQIARQKLTGSRAATPIYTRNESNMSTALKINTPADAHVSLQKSMGSGTVFPKYIKNEFMSTAYIINTPADAVSLPRTSQPPLVTMQPSETRYSHLPDQLGQRLTSTPVTASTYTPLNNTTYTPLNTSTYTPFNTSTYMPFNTSTYMPFNTSTYTPLNDDTRYPFRWNTSTTQQNGPRIPYSYNMNPLLQHVNTASPSMTYQIGKPPVEQYFGATTSATCTPTIRVPYMRNNSIRNMPPYRAPQTVLRTTYNNPYITHLTNSVENSTRRIKSSVYSSASNRLKSAPSIVTPLKLEEAQINSTKLEAASIRSYSVERERSRLDLFFIGPGNRVVKSKQRSCNNELDRVMVQNRRKKLIGLPQCWCNCQPDTPGLLHHVKDWKTDVNDSNTTETRRRNSLRSKTKHIWSPLTLPPIEMDRIADNGKKSSTCCCVQRTTIRRDIEDAVDILSIVKGTGTQTSTRGTCGKTTEGDINVNCEDRRDSRMQQPKEPKSKRKSRQSNERRRKRRSDSKPKANSQISSTK